MRRLTASFIAAALAAPVLLAGPASSVPPGTNGRIALVSGRPGNQAGLFEVWSIDPDGSDPDNLTRSPEAVDLDPAWKPDGSAVAFARKGKGDETFSIWSMNADGKNKFRLTTGGHNSDRQPAWSPTGRIAFTRTVRSLDTSVIWTMDEFGLGQAQLTASPAGTYDGSPAWSPDGAQIAFVSDRTTGFPVIWRMFADGTGQAQVTGGPCWDGNPSWSPDGAALAFERLCPGGSWDIVRKDLFTGAETALTSTGEHDFQPAWSPDGLQVLFTRAGADGNKDLMSVATDGSGIVTPLTSGVGQADFSGDWGTNTSLIVPREMSSPPAVAVEMAPVAAVRDAGDAREMAAPKKKKKKGKKKKKKIKPKVVKGVRFKQLRKARSDVYVLKVDRFKKPRIDVALARDTLAGHEKTARMAKRHGAVAAVNGDFGLPSGRPSHTFAEDGDLKQVSFAVAPNFALSQDESASYFGRPFEATTAVEGGDTWQIERWNFREPPFNDLALFTAVGGTLEVPPANACAARLTPVTGRRMAPGQAGIEVDYSVSAVSCSALPMPLNGGIVLAAQPGSDGAMFLQSLTIGEGVRVSWSVGFPGVADTIGGIPKLVEAGQVVATKCSQSICAKHPRTGVGMTAVGKILLVVVDGRRKDSKGVTLRKFGQIMQSLGAVEAINLDGGGSSTMVIKGKVVNEPSDGKQRRVSSAILVLNRPDRGEQIGPPLARMAPSSPGPVTADPQAAEAAIQDPASTGGLLEAMAEGTFERPVDLRRSLERALEEFLETAP
ncbi:MAG: phosphodiester glycosidase family protein [Actinomycetota bacterium]